MLRLPIGSKEQLRPRGPSCEPTGGSSAHLRDCDQAAPVPANPRQQGDGRCSPAAAAAHAKGGAIYTALHVMDASSPPAGLPSWKIPDTVLDELLCPMDGGK